VIDTTVRQQQTYRTRRAIAVACLVVTGLVAAACLFGAAGAIGATEETTPAPNAVPDCATPPARATGIGGIQWARAISARTPPCLAARAPGDVRTSTPPDPGVIGSPPLTFHGGAVTGTATPGELTVTPVYWVPSGFRLPTGYRNLINRFMTDVAADSAKRTNVFSALTEFTNSVGTKLSYKIHAGTPLDDTTAFPANGCTHDTGAIYSDNSGYTRCITNSQLLTEAHNFTTAKSLPNSDLAHLYMYFMPKHVETCFTGANGAAGGSCGINAQGGFCGYHAFGSPPLVANMSFAVVDSPTGFTCSSDAGSNTGGNESPNSDIEADTEISITSHEMNETITDPQGNAWFDRDGFENGDECAYVFGDSASFVGTSPARHNQVINGHPYFVQEEPSNLAFSIDPQWACEQRDQALVSSATPAADATEVARSSPVVVVFDTAMNKPTAQAAFSLKPTGTGSVVAGAFSWFGNALVFTPHGALASGVQYTATVGAGAKSTLADPLPGVETWKFTVTRHPVVTSVDPAAGATNVFPNALVVAVFDMPMNTAATQSAFSLKRTANGSAVTGAFAWFGNALIFDPDADLPAGVQYTANIGTGAQSTVADALLTAKSWTFTVTSHPVLESFSPPGGGTGVASTATIVARFSKAMNKAVTQAAFALDRASDSSPIAGSFSWFGNALLFTPTAPLAHNTTFHASVGAGAKDTGGRALLNATNWQFTTGAS
jgi:hypothetical protein